MLCRGKEGVKMDQNFMKEKKVLPLVLSMSLPMMLSMLINSLYNIIDSMFVARVGEKALTAISLLFAIQNLKPSPFCLLDEIEAALDDSNVGRFAKYLHKLTKNTQCSSRIFPGNGRT